MLEDISRIPGLEELNLRNCKLTDISALSRQNGLRYLNLHSNPNIDSLAVLTYMPRLESLILRNVPVANQIQHLTKLSGLKRLNLRNTGITDFSFLAKLMQQGALQDSLSQGIIAEVDIRDNPVAIDPGAGQIGYDPLIPYWDNITQREPRELPRQPSRHVIINEIVSFNSDGSDWIELYNPGTEAIKLSGWSLSLIDNDENPWRFPENSSIDPQAYLIILASGENFQNSTDTKGEIHSSYTLPATGCRLILTDSRNRLVDFINIPHIPQGHSYGKINDNSFGIMQIPSPREVNKSQLLGTEIEFSHTSGFFFEEIQLTMQCNEADIFFTLDGSIPDPAVARAYSANRDAAGQQGTFLYKDPIQIQPRSTNLQGIASIPTTVPNTDIWGWKPPKGKLPGATTVRAIASQANFSSQVYTHTYFIDPQLRDGFPLAVFALSTAPENLFAYEKGIYVPGIIYDQNIGYEGNWMSHPANYQSNHEIPVHIAFFEPDGYQGFSQEGGMRIHGGWSRAQPIKSLRLYARKTYSINNAFYHNIFNGSAGGDNTSAVNEFRRLLLRSGQSLFRSHLQDAISHAHAHSFLKVDLLRYRPVIHFINGEYWGIKNLREVFDENYIASHYSIPVEGVIIVEGPLAYDSQQKAGPEGGSRDFRELLQFVERRDMRDPDNFARVQQLMDIDSFIDYNILRIYSADPDGVTKHLAMWKSADHDGRWRWHTWDLDNALMFVNNDTMTFYANDKTVQEHLMTQKSQEDQNYSDVLAMISDDLNAAVQAVKAPRYTALLTGLLQNHAFRRRFINRFADVLNSLYRPEVYSSALIQAAQVIEEELPRHIDRWGYPFSIRYWRSQINQHIDFINRRPEILRRHILDYFRTRKMEIRGTAQIGIDLPTQGGSIRINSLSLIPETPSVGDQTNWQGIYFTGIPIELEAVPKPGWKFTAWTGDIPQNQRENQTITLSFQKDIQISADFSKATERE
ncbi:MAG: hypothetical protein D6B26_07675 [Spirochaetaceae bacterium]|nr:MAG: hypothetical protein D6B26_07675 [Spirochaetaceae bacterium]